MFTSAQFSSPVGLGRTALASFSLGGIMVCSICMILFCWTVNHPDKWLLTQYALYWVMLTFFHFSEFLITAAFKPGFVSYDSFLINHSKAYTIAFIAAQVEYWLELLLTPRIKGNPMVIYSGISLMIFGLYFRIGAMWTAKSNFSHIIEHSKRKDHELITHGVYRYIRHPSYLGWFCFSVGTQLLLGNPICIVLYTLASWNFFSDRIPYEEAILLQFFPTEYPLYRKRTWSGIPGL